MHTLEQDFWKLDQRLSTSSPIPTYRFKNLIGISPYEWIHPVKQKKIHSLVTALLEEDCRHLISHIIVFGSATTLFCDSYSDIDLVVLGYFDHFTTQIPLYKFGEVDLFGYNLKNFLVGKESNTFYKNIWDKGVIVYEQLPTTSKK